MGFADGSAVGFPVGRTVGMDVGRAVGSEVLGDAVGTELVGDKVPLAGQIPSMASLKTSRQPRDVPEDQGITRSFNSVRRRESVQQTCEPD